MYVYNLDASLLMIGLSRCYSNQKHSGKNEYRVKVLFLLNDFLIKPWMLAGQFLGGASHQYLNQTPLFAYKVCHIFSSGVVVQSKIS